MSPTFTVFAGIRTLEVTVFATVAVTAVPSVIV